MSNANNMSDSEEESSQHILGNNNNLDQTGYGTDEYESEENNTKNRGRSGIKGRIYQLTEISYDNEEIAIEKLKNENLFGVKWKKLNTYDGTIWYQCKKCEKRIKLTINNLKQINVHVELNTLNQEGIHEHNRTNESDEDDDYNVGSEISDDIKNEIIRQYKSNSKPQAILEELRRNSIQIPKKMINKVLRKYRKDTYGKSNFTIQDLIDFAKENLNVPDDVDEPFVAQYEHELYPEREFRIFLTTRNLIQLTKHVIFNFLIL
jgi:hypothetical protein